MDELQTVVCGEPFANYKRVIEAVHRITAPAPDGLGISQRARGYADQTGRRVSIEYASIRDINDQDGVRVCSGRSCASILGSWCT